MEVEDGFAPTVVLAESFAGVLASVLDAASSIGVGRLTGMIADECRVWPAASFATAQIVGGNLGSSGRAIDAVDPALMTRRAADRMAGGRTVVPGCRAEPVGI